MLREYEYMRQNHQTGGEYKRMETTARINMDNFVDTMVKHYRSNNHKHQMFCPANSQAEICQYYLDRGEHPPKNAVDLNALRKYFNHECCEVYKKKKSVFSKQFEAEFGIKDDQGGDKGGNKRQLDTQNEGNKRKKTKYNENVIDNSNKNDELKNKNSIKLKHPRYDDSYNINIHSGNPVRFGYNKDKNNKNTIAIPNINNMNINNMNTNISNQNKKIVKKYKEDTSNYIIVAGKYSLNKLKKYNLEYVSKEYTFNCSCGLSGKYSNMMKHLVKCYHSGCKLHKKQMIQCPIETCKKGILLPSCMFYDITYIHI